MPQCCGGDHRGILSGWRSESGGRAMKTVTGPLFLCFWLQLNCEWELLGNKVFVSVHYQSVEIIRLDFSRLPEITVGRKAMAGEWQPDGLLLVPSAQVWAEASRWSSALLTWVSGRETVPLSSAPTQTLTVITSSGTSKSRGQVFSCLWRFSQVRK